ncbi:MATE family efflux transporter [Bengtsoniella intestinalis]|uniref:MATE family efflux transporter n=1 Tax=Bengtsoniella intestinalis TaxID=3073143 RepID=UPI00391F43A5
MNRNQVDLATTPVKKLFFTLSIPTITAQIVNMLYNLVDRMYISRIPDVGDIAFTGVSVCFPIIMFITAFTYLAASGGAPRAAIAQGRGNQAEAEQIMGNSFGLLLLFAAILTPILLFLTTPLLMAFGASDQTVGYGATYLSIYGLGTISVQLTLGLNTFITAQGFTRISMKTVLIGAILNIILDPIFIFALGLGVAGAALATILSQTVSALWVLRFLTGKQTKWHLRRSTMKLRKSVALPSLALGLSPFVMASTESLVAINFNTSLLRYGGDIAVGAYGSMASIMQMVMMPLQGLSQGAQPIASFNYGAKNPDRVRQSFYLLRKVSVIFSLTIWVLVMLFPEVFVGIFLTTDEMIAYGAWGIRIYLGVIGLMGLQIACQQTLMALGDAKTSLFLAALRKIILLIPLIYILPCFLADKDFAVLLAAPVADFLAFTTTFVVFHFRFKKLISPLEK